MDESQVFIIVCLFIVYHISLAYLIHFYVIYSLNNFKRVLADPGQVWDDEDFFMTRWLRAVKQTLQKTMRTLREILASFK